MTKVGFYGGSLFIGLGPASDMKVFFSCIAIASERLPPNSRGDLLTDRLYRRYLRLDELDPAAALLDKIRAIMSEMQTKDIDLERAGWNSTMTVLKPSESILANFLKRYLDNADEIIREARGFEKRFHIYKPVFTIITDTPRFYKESLRPLAEYDALDGEPFWLR